MSDELKIRKMRTIKQVKEICKEMDSDTSISENYIRKLCKANQIRFAKVGVKILVDLENFINYINGNSEN